MLPDSKLASFDIRNPGLCLVKWSRRLPHSRCYRQATLSFGFVSVRSDMYSLRNKYKMFA